MSGKAAPVAGRLPAGPDSAVPPGMIYRRLLGYIRPYWRVFLLAAVGMAATNEFRPALADRLNVTLTVSERQDTSTIERVWLDTTRPKAGETRTLSILLRHYRGGTETVTMPVTMPAQASGPITLLVSDAPSLSAIEERDLRPGRPSTWPA